MQHLARQAEIDDQMSMSWKAKMSIASFRNNESEHLFFGALISPKWILCLNALTANINTELDKYSVVLQVGNSLYHETHFIKGVQWVNEHSAFSLVEVNSSTLFSIWIFFHMETFISY